MNFGAASYGLGLLAGLLSTLSPCVLPIIPILLGSAANAHPRAPLTLAGGLALSYALIGTAIAWAGASLGLDTSIFLMAGAVLLGALGLVLMSAPLQARLAAAIVLASQGSDLPQVALLLGVFGVGAALPIVGLAYASRTATSRMRGNLLQAGK